MEFEGLQKYLVAGIMVCAAFLAMFLCLAVPVMFTTAFIQQAF